MTVADELATRARHFYALARKALDPSTKDRLVRLADDYLKQAHELRQANTFTPIPQINTSFKRPGNKPPDTL